MLATVQSIAGMLGLLAIAFAFSTDRRRISLKTVAVGMLLQIVLALIVLKTGPGKDAFHYIGRGFNLLLDYTTEGSRFVFGALIEQKRFGYVFALHALPVIVFVSALSAVLYHFGILQAAVGLMAKVFTRFMGLSGAESLSVAANVFVGMVEAPLLIRPYVEGMTTSELFCLMSAGMATIAGSVMAAYIGILKPYLPDVAGHILAASVMSAPAAVVVAKIMIPETQEPLTGSKVSISYEKSDVNFIDALSRGAMDGMKLAINVAALLIAIVAAVALINGILGLVGLRFETIVGYCFSPLAFLMGVPYSEALTVGKLLGEKTVLNEFVAYLHLAQMLKANPHVLSPKAVVIATYGMCGFANFGSLGIMIAGVGGIAPGRKGDLAKLGIKSIISGTLAAFLTGAIAGLFL